MWFPLKKELNLDGPWWWRSSFPTRPFNLIPSLPQGVPKSARLEAIWGSSSIGLNKTNFSCGLWKETFSIRGLVKTRPRPRLWCGRDSKYDDSWKFSKHHATKLCQGQGILLLLQFRLYWLRGAIIKKNYQTLNIVQTSPIRQVWTQKVWTLRLGPAPPPLPLP